MSLFHRSKQYTMSKIAADATLQNVFNACDTPDSNHIDVMIKKSALQSPGMQPRIMITILVLGLTILMPLLFAPGLCDSKYVSTRADVSINEYSVEDGVLFIDLDGQFINLKSMYAVNPQGETMYPSSVNVWKDQVYFDYDDTEWNIYVNDTNGNTVHMLLTPLS